MALALCLLVGLGMVVLLLMLSAGPIAAQEGEQEGTDETPAATPTVEPDDTESIKVTVETCIEDPETGEWTCTETAEPAGEIFERDLARDDREGKLPRACFFAGGQYICNEEIEINGLVSTMDAGSSDGFTVKGKFLTGGHDNKLRVSRDDDDADIGFNAACSAVQVTVTVPTSTAIGFDYSHAFTLYGCSSDGGTVTAEVLRGTTLRVSTTQDVTVRQNNPPVISGTSFRRYDENGTEAVGTYTATDPDGDTVTLSLTGTDAGRFTLDSDGDLKFRSAPDYENPVDSGTNNIYNVTVRATDNGSPVATSELNVTIVVSNVNEPPVIRGSTSERQPENSPATDVLATYTVSDPEGDSAAFSLAGIDGGNFVFSINDDDGIELRFSSSPDYESPVDSDGNNRYVVTLRATDNGSPAATGQLDVIVVVTNVNEPPVVHGPSSESHPENSDVDEVIASYRASDPDLGDTVTWSLINSVFGRDSVKFRINSDGELTFRKSPNFEMADDFGENNIYNVTVRTRDRGGLFDDHNVTITVTDENDKPKVASQIGDLTLQLEADPVISGATRVEHLENDDSDVALYTVSDEDDDNVTLTLTGTDSGDFILDSDGYLKFMNTPNYEMPDDSGRNNTYDIRLIARDDGSPRRTSQLNVTIVVGNVNDKPKVASQIGDLTLQLEADPVTIGLTGKFSDEDSGNTFTYGADSSDPGVADASVSGSDLTITAVGSGSTTVTVTAYDKGGLTAEQEFDVTVPNAHDPVISGATRVEHLENDDSDVALYTVSDEDDDNVTLTLAGTDSGDFILDSDGHLKFKITPNYEMPGDFGRNNTYDIRLIARDDGSPARSTQLDVAITVVNVNEPPHVATSIGGQTLAWGTGTTTIGIADKFTDVDGDTLTYSASSANTGVVTATVIGSTLAIAQVGPGATTVTVTAEDPSGLTVFQSFRVDLLFPDATSPTITVNPRDRTKINVHYALTPHSFHHQATLFLDGNAVQGQDVGLTSAETVFSFQPSDPGEYAVGIRLCRTAQATSCGAYAMSTDALTKPRAPTDLDVQPLRGRKALLTWTDDPDVRATRYTMRITTDGHPQNVRDEKHPYEINLDRVIGVHGFIDRDSFEIQVSASDPTSPVLDSSFSEKVTIKGDLIESANGFSPPAPGQLFPINHKVTVSWSPPAGVQTVMVRYRRLRESRPGISHTSAEWRLNDSSYPSTFDGEVIDPTPTDGSITVSGLQRQELYALQLMYDAGDGWVYSTRDAFAWPSGHFPDNSSRVGTFPFFGHWEGGDYEYTVCDDTFTPADERGDWVSLIESAFGQWQTAAPDILTITHDDKPCLYGSDPISNDRPMTMLKALYNESNEVYMVDTSEWMYPAVQIILNNSLFFCITGGGYSAPAGACVISPRYRDPNKGAGLELEGGSVDVLVNVSRADKSVDSVADVSLNICLDDSGDPVVLDDRKNYETMVHEAGHALGLSDYEEGSWWNLYAVDELVAHSAVIESTMYHSFLETPEHECSPLPLDIMAIYALYQTLGP